MTDIIPGCRELTNCITLLMFCSRYEPPSLAIANLYWSGWIVILLVAAFNPSNIGIEFYSF